MPTPPNSKTHDAYLATLPPDRRAALEKLRKIIKSAAPKAEECISYQLCAFRQNGPLVAYGATKNHCAFYVMSGTTLEKFKDDLKAFDTSKGTIRFQPENPLPASLIRKLVKTRIAENESRLMSHLWPPCTLESFDKAIKTRARPK